MREKQMRESSLRIGLAIHRLVNKVDDATLKKIKPELEEIEAEVLKMTEGGDGVQK